DGRSRMAVRPAGLLRMFGTQLRLPDGPDAMKNTLRPCTMFGFRNSLQSLIDVYQAARKANECREEYGGATVIDGSTCIVLIRTLPAKKDYPAKKTILCLDARTLLPLRVIGYDWQDRLVCNYEVRDVTFNTGLGEKDFTPEANGMKPPKE
ncbi:unnamed protein product, partial [marine sediment metagenome]